MNSVFFQTFTSIFPVVVAFAATRRDATNHDPKINSVPSATPSPVSSAWVKQDDAHHSSCLEVAAKTRPSLVLEPRVRLINTRGPNSTQSHMFFPVLYLDLQPLFSAALQLQRNTSIRPSSLA